MSNAFTPTNKLILRTGKSYLPRPAEDGRGGGGIIFTGSRYVKGPPPQLSDMIAELTVSDMLMQNNSYFNTKC